MRPCAPGLEPKSPFVSPVKRMLLVCSLAAVSASLACTPPTPAQKATDAARQLNMAARWGRMEEAMGRSADDERVEFAKRRQGWHRKVKILETELSGLNMKDATHASVQVEVSWMFADDPTLRTTQLSQEWSDESGRWEMTSEEEVGGDKGLFGEEVKRMTPTRDRHFPSQTIR